MNSQRILDQDHGPTAEPAPFLRLVVSNPYGVPLPPVRREPSLRGAVSALVLALRALR